MAFKLLILKGSLINDFTTQGGYSLHPRIFFLQENHQIFHGPYTTFPRYRGRMLYSGNYVGRVLGELVIELIGGPTIVVAYILNKLPSCFISYRETKLSRRPSWKVISAFMYRLTSHEFKNIVQVVMGPVQ